VIAIRSKEQHLRAAAPQTKPEPAADANASAILNGRMGVSAKVAAGMLLPVGLLSFILLAQLFNYRYWQVSINILFAVTPDRLLFIALVLAGVSAWLSGKLRPKISGGRSEVYLMLLLGLLTTSSWFIAGVDFGVERYRWLATLLNMVYMPFGVYLLVKNTYYSRPVTVNLFWRMMPLGVYLVFTGLCEHYKLNSLVWPKYILDPHVGTQAGRVRGPFVTSVAMGDWMIALFMICCLLLPLATGAKKLFLRVMLPLTCMVIYFTDQRSVWLGFACTIAVMAWFGRGQFRKQSIIVVMLVGVVFWAGVASKLSARQETLFSRRQQTVDYRLANYATAFRMGMGNFFTGVGYGNFVNEWRNYFGSDQRKLASNLDDGNHNTYLGLFAETGIFGVLFYASLLGTMALRALRFARRWRSDEEVLERNFAVGTFALVIVMMIEAFFSDLRFFPSTNTLVFLMLAILMSMSEAKAARTAELSGAA
jgi:hypothetical protein